MSIKDSIKAAILAISASLDAGMVQNIFQQRLVLSFIWMRKNRVCWQKKPSFTSPSLIAFQIKPTLTLSQ
tara:strand:+ start:21 stop:230 length:210 start_codon:yes stop_codon:yes gene_type:complete